MTETPPEPSFGLHAALMRHTGFLISRVGMIARKRFGERLEAMGLNVRMWGALNVLDAEGALSQHALGKCVGIDPSSMVATIDELEAIELVQRRRHPTDRRAHALHLTAKGRQTLARGRELARGAQDELLAPLDAQEREQLHELLLRIAIAAHSEEIAGAGAGVGAAESAGAGVGESAGAGVGERAGAGVGERAGGLAAAG